MGNGEREMDRSMDRWIDGSMDRFSSLPLLVLIKRRGGEEKRGEMKRERKRERERGWC